MPDQEAVARAMKARPRAYRDHLGRAWEWDEAKHMFVLEATEETPTMMPKASFPLPEGVQLVTVTATCKGSGSVVVGESGEKPAL